jgi:hypothetical protein
MGIFGFSGERPAAAFAGAAWPRDRIEAAILKRYQNAEGPHLRDDYVLYGVIEGSVAFVIVLHHIAGRSRDIDQLLFYTRFEGFGVDESTAAAINRNMHLAAAQIRDGALDIFAGVEPSGPYEDKALFALFDAWKRDLAVVVGMLTGGDAFASAAGLTRDPAIAKLAVNSAGAQPPGDLFRSFFGGGERALCSACDGRGRIGFIARTCGECGGAGIVKQRGR